MPSFRSCCWPFSLPFTFCDEQSSIQSMISDTTPDVLRNKLNAAHTLLVEALQISALLKHESIEEISEAIECLQASFVWLRPTPQHHG